MNIRNLVNKQAVSISNCDLEPIHIPGTIQSYGYLLGLDKDKQTILYCSENCTQLFGKELGQIFGRPLQDFFSTEQVVAFMAYFTEQNGETKPYVLTSGRQVFHVTSFSVADILVLELEPIEDENIPLPDLFIQSQRFVYFTERADNLKQLCQDVADETRRITNYDRVMIYRFNADLDGEVFAESKIEELDTFLGLHYPASDIPPPGTFFIFTQSHSDHSRCKHRSCSALFN